MNERKVTKSGSVTVPAHMRKILGITSGDIMSIMINDEGNITLERRKVCVVCNTIEQVLSHGGLNICSVCLGSFKKGDE